MSNKNSLFKYVISITVIIIVSLLVSASFVLIEKNESGVLPQSYRIISPELPEEIYFAGEKIPLDNYEIRERLDREIVVNTYWHSSTILNIKKANRWFPIIEPILEEYEIPNDFKYLSLIESNLTNAISPKNAVGFWQFLKSTGKRYGLEINRFVDERYHVEKSTIAACKYLLEAKEKFGTWTLAAASYNMGITGVSEQMERQKEGNYFDLLLNEETSRYIFRIVAARTIMNDPASFGFQINYDSLYPELDFKIVKVNSQINHWADFAKNHGINYKILKNFNPWLRDKNLPNKKKKTYEIKIPIDDGVK